MSGPVGHTYIYNLIILFIVIVFAFLAGIMSYYKAFKVNNSIVYSIEKYEGYNELSKAEIQRTLTTLGYDASTTNLNCDANYKGLTLVQETSKSHRYCIYLEERINTSGDHGKNTYFVYGVKTYMSINLPFVSWIRIPIFTKTNQIYKFTTTEPKTP